MAGQHPARVLALGMPAGVQWRRVSLPQPARAHVTMHRQDFIPHPSLRGMAAAALLALSVGVHAQTAPGTPGAAAVPVSVEAAFQRADKDGVGRLSPVEAADAGLSAARFAELDADKDGFLSKAEFAAGMKPAR